MNRLYNLYELESINYKLVEKIVESSALDAVQKNTRQEFKRFCTSDKEINAIIKEIKMRKNLFDFDSVFGLIEYGVSVRILEPFKGDQINIRTYNLNTINMLKYEYGFSTVKFEKIRKAFVKYYIVGNQLNENFYDDYQKVYNYFVENKLGQTIAKTDLYIKLREIGFNKKNFQDVIEEMLFDRTIVKKGIGLELSLLPLEEEIKLAPKNELFEMRLTGLTLEEIGEKMNITRERVRQVINTYVKTLKLTQVDIYAKLFCTYRLSESEFKYMTKLSNKEYYYLCARYSRGVEDVVNLLEDKQFKYLNLDVDMFEEYKEATNEIKIKPHSRTKIVQRFVEKNMKQPMRTIDEVCVAINVFSENLKLENPIVFEKRQLYGYLTRNGNVLFSYGNKVRFYDVQKNFHQSYRKIIRVVNELKKGFYSTSYFINSHSSLFVDELKLQNEYEIHNFLRQTIEDLDIVFERTPHFSIGGISKDEFVKAEIQKFGVFEKKAFINHLYDKYGLGKNAFEIYIDSQMKQYKKNGLLVLNLDLQNESPITDVKLTELMYTKEEVKKIFENTFPEKDFWKNVNLELYRQKYHTSFGSMRYYRDPLKSDRDYIMHIFEELGEFTRKDIPRGNLISKSIEQVINQKRMDFTYLQIDESVFVTESRMSEMGIKREQLFKFIEEVEKKVAQFEYFTINDIEEEIKKSPLAAHSFKEIFYIRLLVNSQKFNVFSVCGQKVLVKASSKLSTENYLMTLIEKNHVKTMESLMTIMEAEFKVSLRVENIRRFVKKFGNIIPFKK